MNSAVILGAYGLVLYFVLWRPVVHIDRHLLERALSVGFGLYLGAILSRWDTGTPVTATQWMIVVAGLVLFAVVFRAQSDATSGSIAGWAGVFGVLLAADAAGMIDLVAMHRLAAAAGVGS